MNLSPSKKWLILALALVNGFFAGAQSTDVPGPADYTAFSQFITERNIFDPNRYPRHSSGQPSYHPPISRSAPTFTLVGTMNYQKGMFAFFDGNSSDLRKVLYESDSNSIAGYTVAEITLTGVTLRSADKKKLVAMKIGEAMHRAGNEWQPAGRDELPASTADSATPAEATPASAGEPNDILKKLMQQREKELK